MHLEYPGVITRFLRDDERFILSKANDMPLVIEAKNSTSLECLQDLLATHSDKILDDLADYGAILLRGFAIASEREFEQAVLSIHQFRGISEAFMSEEGRTHIGDLKFVLHTNAVYKTGGTLYLGGFHSENYYSPDVPSYISFCCLNPSRQGGETGLVNMEKVYEHLSLELKNKLEKNTFFVSKWLISEVAHRYQVSIEDIEKIARYFNLPIIGEGNQQCIAMYKPSVFMHPRTKKKSLQINLFELRTLNAAMRKHFINDYKGKAWFWHRLVWRLPEFTLKILEFFYVITASFYYSPKGAIHIALAKLEAYRASKKINKLSSLKQAKVGSCFNEQDIQCLAQLIRDHYSSCLWQKGDILLVDNRKIVHAGMPGAGPRTIRALIANPLDIQCSCSERGVTQCQERMLEPIGYYMSSGKLPIKSTAS